VKPVLTLQVPGASGRYEHFYRMVLEDDRADTLRKAITTLKKKPSAYEIGSKSASPWSTKPPKRQRAVRGDEGVIPGVEEVVDRALDN
jgi:hypothetical protein